MASSVTALAKDNGPKASEERQSRQLEESEGIKLENARRRTKTAESLVAVSLPPSRLTPIDASNLRRCRIARAGPSFALRYPVRPRRSVSDVQRAG